MTIWFASGNLHKKKELEEIIAANAPKKNWEIKIPSDAGIEFNPDETGSTFQENALLKASELYRILNEKQPSFFTPGDPVIADDSGLCVDALGGRPGVHSARYGGANLEAAGKNALLLSELGDNPNRKARFVCAMVLYFTASRYFTAQETLEGELVRDTALARGKGGFGYDPILFIPELGLTVAELSGEEKNRISHRGKAGKVISKILFNGFNFSA